LPVLSCGQPFGRPGGSRSRNPAPPMDGLPAAAAVGRDRPHRAQDGSGGGTKAALEPFQVCAYFLLAIGTWKSPVGDGGAFSFRDAFEHYACRILGDAVLPINTLLTSLERVSGGQDAAKSYTRARHPHQFTESRPPRDRHPVPPRSFAPRFGGRARQSRVAEICRRPGGTACQNVAPACLPILCFSCGPPAITADDEIIAAKVWGTRPP
jgi:hypothetical protein